jgi:hypothetical protein
LAFDEGDYASMFDIQDSIIVEPEIPYVEKVEPNSAGGGTRSPMTPWDWRDVNGMNYVTEEIEDQGVSGMCYAVATSLISECAFNIAINAYSKESGPDNSEDMVDFSTGYVAFCGKACDDTNILGYWGTGGYAYNLFPLEFVYENGITDEADQGTSFSEYGVCGTAQLQYDRSFFAGWGSVSTSTESIKGAILSYGPLYANIKMSDSWNSYDPSGENFEDYIIVDSIPEACGYYGGSYHAVVIVGWDYYDDEFSEADGLYWIVRNSKGSEWGVDGYAYVHEHSLKIQCQVGYIDGDQPYVDADYFDDDGSNRNIDLEDAFPVADSIGWEVTPQSIFDSPYTGTGSTASIDTDPPAGDGQRGYIQFDIERDSLSLCPEAPDKIVTVIDSIWVGNPQTPTINGYSAIGCFIEYEYEIDESDLEGSQWYIFEVSSNIDIISSDTTEPYITIEPILGGTGWIQVYSHNVNGYRYGIKYVNITCVSFAIFPNPTDEQLNVEIDDDSSNNSYNLEIINSKGIIKKNKKSKSKSIILSVLDLENGNYLARINAFNEKGIIVGSKTIPFIISK